MTEGWAEVARVLPVASKKIHFSLQRPESETYQRSGTEEAPASPEMI